MGPASMTMDLYKWAYKLDPLTPSDLVGDCFALARDVRELDMRASPYDLSGLGLEPVRMETHEGKAEYVAAQRAFAEPAADLRRRLIDLCDAVHLPDVQRFHDGVQGLEPTHPRGTARELRRAWRFVPDEPSSTGPP